LKDDKTYPWLALSVNDPWPRPFVYRGKRRKGVVYFGPFPHVRSLRQTLDLVVKTFPVRTCSDAKFARHEKYGRPCLLADIGRCSAPCVGRIDADSYATYVDGLSAFFAGETAEILEDLTTKMERAAQERAYELAARARDQLSALEEASSSQQVVVDASGDFDAFGLVVNDLEASIAVLHVRHGRLVGRSGFIVDRIEVQAEAELLLTLVERFYAERATSIPRQVLSSVDVDESKTVVIEQWLADQRGGPVTITSAHRGRRRQVLAMAVDNARQDLARHQLRRSSDHNARSKALTELQRALELREAPLRIECYDMSHLQGTDYVGSMVVFEDGIAKRSDYRHFLIKTVEGNDDFAAMAEVLRRRLTRLDDEVQPGRRRFAYRPQLLLIDGGKGQLSSVVSVLDELGLRNDIEVASLAKQFEEVYRPGFSRPHLVPRGSDALYLLQALRDEAHRFAISFHRQRRGARMTESVLDGIPGLGPTRQKRLLEHYGTLRDLRSADLQELLEVSWLPDAVAHAVYDRLHREAHLPVAALDDRSHAADDGGE
jgi:excinuclease ABC subunit C